MNQLTAYDPFADAGIDELFRGFFRPVRVEKSPATSRWTSPSKTTHMW